MACLTEKEFNKLWEDIEKNNKEPMYITIPNEPVGTNIDICNKNNDCKLYEKKD